MFKLVPMGIFFLIVGVIMASTTDARSKKVDAVKEIDFEQFSGTWYEIARLPNKHEKELVEVTSTFTRTKDGGYAVVNRGYKGSRGGKCTTLKGEVVIPDPKVKGAMKLKVWWVDIDYRVIHLDQKNYQYAVISSQNKNFLWIMSKQPIMDPEQYKYLVDTIRKQGYKVDKLEKVQQVHNSAVARK